MWCPFLLASGISQTHSLVYRLCGKFHVLPGKGLFLPSPSVVGFPWLLMTEGGIDRLQGYGKRCNAKEALLEG